MLLSPKTFKMVKSFEYLTQDMIAVLLSSVTDGSFFDVGGDAVCWVQDAIDQLL